MSRICLADWDGTLRPGFILLDWLVFLASSKKIHPTFAKNFRSLLKGYEEGTLSYTDLVVRAGELYALAVKNQSQVEFYRLARQFVLNDSRKLFEFTMPILNLMSDFNIKVVVVSGGPVEVLEAYKQILPISSVYALTPETDSSNTYTGFIHKNYGLITEKSRIASAFENEFDKVLFAIGNAMTDEPLFKAAKHSFLLMTEETNTKLSCAMHAFPQTIFFDLQEILQKES